MRASSRAAAGARAAPAGAEPHAPEPAPFDEEPSAEPERATGRGGAARPLAEPPAAKERLSRIFADDVLDADGPAYGRDEPTLQRRLPRRHARTPR